MGEALMEIASFYRFDQVGRNNSHSKFHDIVFFKGILQVQEVCKFRPR